MADKFLYQLKGSEIIIGLVGAVGTNLGLVSEVIEEELSKLNYHTEIIRLSDILKEIPLYKKECKANVSEDVRISSLMEAGDSLRKETNAGEALALLGISAIREIRLQKCGAPEKPIPRQAYVFQSLKHPEEVKKLRKIYGGIFTLISVYSPRSERVDRLAEKIAESKKNSDASPYRSKAEALVVRDAKSGDKEYGQNVQDAFPGGDFFIRMAEKEAIRKEIRRFLECWFGYPFHTPKKDEYGMFLAHTVSLRSADLSRQVGAVIANEDGEVLAVGCNEVPKAQGGAVWEGDEGDYRDFQLGYDSSAVMKDKIVSELLGRLKEKGWLTDELNDIETKTLIDKALYDNDAPLNGARVASILEFGRIVHAEMSAIMDAARRGVPLQGATLYCTTFPCHMCARHIIAAGIKRVVFIEPYPKSMAKILYYKSIHLDEEGASDGSVFFESFVGVSPNRYIELFSMKKRKGKDGTIVKWKPSESFPSVNMIVPTYLDVETIITAHINENREAFGLDAKMEKTKKGGGK
ncbi:MAG TPA: anti-phage dCTP deaminase [Desulfuromonadaceae bacterium]|jgi:cytidine deaminase